MEGHLKDYFSDNKNISKFMNHYDRPEALILIRRYLPKMPKPAGARP